MKEPEWIAIEVILAIHEAQLAEHGGATGIRDRALLESALARPKNLFAYSANVSLNRLAAARLPLELPRIIRSWMVTSAPPG